MKKKGWIILRDVLVIAVIVLVIMFLGYKFFSAISKSRSDSMVSKNQEIDNQQTEQSVLDKLFGKDETADVNEEIYDRLYEHMKEHQPDYSNSRLEFGAVMEDVPAEEEAMADGAIPEAPAADELADYAEESIEMNDMSADFAGTNIQVEFVDEGDIVKNDGRYLYQLLQNDDYQYGIIQIVDTKDGLKEVAQLDEFNNISEFYIWKDSLVVVERLWANAVEEAEVAYDVYYMDTSFSKIHFYDISDRAKPEKIHSFTIKGEYKTSRISEGYLYFFSTYHLNEAADKDKPETFIPTVGGELLTHDCLYLPEDITSTSYLIMVSVDLANPISFADKMAVVCDGNRYYVSGDNIYVLENVWADYEQEGVQCDKTKIVRFAYDKGQIEVGREGCVDGLVNDQFAMDEYKGYFRIITTVNPYSMEAVVDDFSGELLGYYNVEALPETNSVYVLDQGLNVVGAIEGLAEEERVYSARFMGDTGYFVTFRQTDPLFSVDFSDPKNPKILGELKISGFSEYLHFYGENQLVGIGYEADEETGITDGVKISMFDISNPGDVKEINKLVLDEYDYCDAFYNHHAVLISAKKNVIGFVAEGYEEEWIREYGIYSYDSEDGFDQNFTVDCKSDGYGYTDVRGTYIGDTFYMLKQHAGIEAYDLNSGQLIDTLELE